MARGWDELEVWFAVGSVELYGEAALTLVEQQANEIARGLNASIEIPVAVSQPHVLTSAEAIHRLMMEASGTNMCLGVITWMHTFSPAKMWIQGLATLQKPLLHLHTQFNHDLPWKDIDMEFMNLNQSAHGDREFGYLATRMKLQRTTVVGHWDDPFTQQRIGSWVRSARGWNEARNMKVARFGDNMRDVAVTEGDKVEAQLRLGFSVNGYGTDVLGAAIGEIQASAINALVEEYENSYRVAPELLANGEKRSSLLQAARIELGLRAFLEDGGFGAFTNTFEDLGPLRQLPGISAQRLMADGYGFAAEGDWKTAALLRVVKAMEEGLDGGSSFMEDYTYHFSSDDSLILGAHMLELCPSLAAEQPSCEVHPLAHGGREDPVRLVFTAAAGPGLVVSLLDLGGRFRFVANEIAVVSPPDDLPKLGIARALWRPQPDLYASAESWLRAGGPHHTVLTSTVSANMLADLAEAWRSEFVLIDAHTDVRSLTKELRWNEAYYGAGWAD